MAKGRYLTLEDAAREAGKTVSWVKDGIRRGELAWKLEGRKWLVCMDSLGEISEEARRRHVEVPENLGASGRVATGGPSPNARDEKTDGKPIGGIAGYHAGKSETERKHPSTGDAALEARLLILRSRAQASAREMRDRGKSRAARDAAAVRWAEARREAENLERELRAAPTQVKEPETPRAVATDRPNSSKARSEAPDASRRSSTSSPPLGASSKSSARAAGKGERSGPRRDAASYRRDGAAREISRISRLLKEKGHPAPLGDPASGVVLVVEQPVGPRVLEALKACLRAVELPEAYVTYASTGLLRKEVLAIEPRALIAVGPGGAREINVARYPFARRSFSEAELGVWFSWKKGTRGLLLPSLAPALDDEAAKRRFWRAFLGLKDLAPTRARIGGGWPMS